MLTAEHEPSDIFSSLDTFIEGTKGENKHVTQGRVRLPVAPNPIVFIESPDFLSGPNPLFPEQYKMTRDVFELLCPKCNDLVRIHTQDDIPRDEQILFEWGRCPVCKQTKADFEEGTFRFFDTVNGVVGMRAGKSAWAASVAAALLHYALTYERMSQELGIFRAQRLDASFAAAAGEQAQETVYGQFRSMYSESPWFQQYKQELMRVELAEPNLRRGDLYQESTRVVYWKDAQIKAESIPANSATQAGRTRLFAIVDELSRMDAGNAKQSATEVYRVMERSLRTVRSAIDKIRKNENRHDLLAGFMVSISSPLFSTDKSMNLLKQAKVVKRMFTFHKATWEFNPTITREELNEEYAKDPLGAERDYGANPPGAENPFVEDPDIIEAAIDPTKQNMFTYREKFFKKHISTKLIEKTYYYVRLLVSRIDFNHLYTYYVHCDPGEAGDSFCLAIGHNEESIKRIDGALEIRPIRADNKMGLPPHTVYFPAVTEIILMLNDTLSLGAVGYDRWNSTEQIQRLLDSNVHAFKANLTRDEHVDFLADVRNRSCLLPTREHATADPAESRCMPCAKALWELATLEDTGTKVDHPKNGSNDMIQCYVGVHRMLTKNLGTLSNRKNVRRARPMRPRSHRMRR